MFETVKLKTMKKLALLAIAFIASTALFAQTEKKVEKVEKIERVEKIDKKEVRKEVKFEENNGEKTLTITTSENGKVTEEVYKGAEAEKKMQEMEASMKSEKITEDVEVTDENGVKVVKIVRNENGKITEEVYKGADAEKKLKEMEMNAGSGKTMHKEEQRIEIKKEIHNE